MKKDYQHIAKSRSALPSRQLGFTLAEILIVLTIIGVMAVMTIPSLMQNANSQQKIALFKKAINAVFNAYSTEFAVKTPPKTFSDRSKLWEALNNQLNVKYYYIASDTSLGSSSSTTFTKKYTKISVHDKNWLVGEDGIAFNVYYTGSIMPSKLSYNERKCTVDSVCGKEKSAMGATPLHIFIDINGTAKPNTMCPDDIDLDKLDKCDIMMIGVTTNGIAIGNPDCTFAGRLMSDNNNYDASKCQ